MYQIYDMNSDALHPVGTRVTTIEWRGWPGKAELGTVTGHELVDEDTSVPWMGLAVDWDDGSNDVRGSGLVMVDQTVYFEKTGGACPEQYDAYWCGKRVAYLRVRHGELTVSVPDEDGEIILTANTAGDGSFEQAERYGFLRMAAQAICTHCGS